MSDSSISIVPMLSDYPDKDKKAKEIIDWLVALDIVKPVLSDCILSSEMGYAISTGAKLVTEYPEELPFGMITNGLEIVTKRHIFHTGEYGIEELICPNCQEDIAMEDWFFFDEWYDHKSNDVTCPLCKVNTEIHEFKFTPAWGFSDLGFTFWNWAGLKDKFIQEFRNKLDCEITIVDQYI